MIVAVLVACVVLLAGCDARPGDVVNKVSRGGYECGAEVAITIDASGSIGSETASRMSANVASSLINQLSRLPSSTGRGDMSANLHIIYFNKMVDTTVINARGKSFRAIRASVTSALQEASNASGATALTYAIEQGGMSLVTSGTDGLPKVLITITDGKDNASKGRAVSATPQEAATKNQNTGITQMSVGVIGEGGDQDSGVISDIGVEGSYEVEDIRDVSEVSLTLADSIAKLACSRV